MGIRKVFMDRPEGVGGDDHEPFLRAGIDSVDIIQLNGYPYWHKADDTLDKVSAQSMKIVGDAVLASLPRIEQYVQSKAAVRFLYLHIRNQVFRVLEALVLAWLTKSDSNLKVGL